MLPSVGDKNPQISLSRGVVLSQSTFHLALELFLLQKPVACWLPEVKFRRLQIRFWSRTPPWPVHGELMTLSRTL